MDDRSVWNFRQGTTIDAKRLVGYTVNGTDGKIGDVSDATFEVDSSTLVVDTGPWLAIVNSCIPAAAVRAVDDDAKEIAIDLSKEEVEQAPILHDRFTEEYRRQADAYWSPFGGRWAASVPGSAPD